MTARGRHDDLRVSRDPFVDSVIRGRIARVKSYQNIHLAHIELRDGAVDKE